MTGTYVLFLLLGANNDPVISDSLPEADCHDAQPVVGIRG